MRMMQRFRLRYRDDIVRICYIDKGIFDLLQGRSLFRKHKGQLGLQQRSRSCRHGITVIGNRHLLDEGIETTVAQGTG